jgi:predicted O-linked N-acetylglucosamine transferase (SPINDLY family)
MGAARADALIAEGMRSEASSGPAEALRYYRAAVEAAPAYPAAHVNLGIALEAAGDAEGAVRAWEGAIALQPGHPAANYNLGRACLVAGDAVRAETHLRTALASRPDFPEAWVVLAGALEARGDAAGAQAALESVLAQRPDLAGAWRNLGMLLAGQGRWSEAAEALGRCLTLEPRDAEAQYWIGNALVHLQRPADAESAYRAAVGAHPGLAAAWCNLGNLLLDRGARAEAAASLERAVSLRPDLADGHVGLGNLHAANHRLDEAATAYRRALALEPRLADAWVNLGNVLKDQGAWREADDAYRAAQDADPGSVEARWALVMAQLPLVRGLGEDLPAVRARFSCELDSLQAWLETRPPGAGWRAVGVQQPFALAYHEENNRALLASYGALCARQMQAWRPGQARASAPRSGRMPIRVGVVSQFFRDHSVWRAIVRGWFAHLDPARVMLQAFCLKTLEDVETRFARARAERFEQGHAGLLEWVRAIENARPDVLVFPEVGMDPMTLKLASLRLAPVQLASWGHPETTGLPTMDAFLSAADMEPLGAERHYTERLVLLPNLGCAVRPGVPTAEPLDVRALGLDPRRPILVCPGTPFKYAPEHDATYAEIARRLGGCQLVFFEYQERALSGRLRERLAGALGRHGVDPEACLRFVPWQAPAAFRALLAASHVYLDTLGFSGFNTALQAVESGLPIVTREGRFLRGRLASSILRRIGLEELVAVDDEGYIGRAVRLAREPDYRDDVRRRMAAARPVLYDDLEPIRGLERFLDQAL